MGKYIISLEVEFNEQDNTEIDLRIISEVEGDLNAVQGSMCLFFKRAIEAQAEHSANQAVEYGAVVNALVEANNDRYED